MGFGSFESICAKTALPLCAVIGNTDRSTVEFATGIIPSCYSRPVELANTMIFQIGNAFIHIGALIMGLIMIINVRAKYTAIGRSEMLSFFYLYIGLVISSLVVDCGVLPPAAASYPYFVALQIALVSALCVCLLYNGILCFQFWEDGSRKSMLVMHAACAGWFVVNFVVALFTFKLLAGFDNHSTTGLFVCAYVVNAVLLAVYVVSQLVLVFFALDSLWYLGAIVLFSFFFVVGQVLVYVLNNKICTGTTHYVDGLFFGSLCNLFAVMMVYKFWDMITTEDLEFSVASVEHGVTAFGDLNEKRLSGYFY